MRNLTSFGQNNFSQEMAVGIVMRGAVVKIRDDGWMMEGWMDGWMDGWMMDG